MHFPRIGYMSSPKTGRYCFYNGYSGAGVGAGTGASAGAGIGASAGAGIDMC